VSPPGRCPQQNGRANAGRAGESVDFESRVVGEDQFSRSEARIINGLELSVGSECGTDLFGSGNGFEIRKKIDGYGMCRRGGAEVAQFSLAGTGNEQAKCHMKSVIARIRRFWTCLVAAISEHFVFDNGASDSIRSLCGNNFKWE
jgi:hypothetical protein